MSEPATETALPNLDQIDSFDSKDAQVTTFDRYSGRTGCVDRLAFVGSTITRAFVHFHGGKGFRCLSGKDKKAICCETVGAPEQKFGLVVFHYRTDERGALIDANRCSGSLKLWTFSENRFAGLRDIAREWPLLDRGADAEQVDLLVKCTDDKWQRLEINPCREAHWKKKAEWYQAIHDRLGRATEKLQALIGKTREESEVREILGIATPLAQTSGGAGEVDLSDVLDG